MGFVLRFGNQASFDKALQSVVLRWHKKKEDVYRVKIRKLLKILIRQTPADTGAAKGDTSGARREVYNSHPAFGAYAIGNEVGESGWQIIEDTHRGGVRLRIVNPMWDFYYKYVEYDSNSAHAGNVRAAVQQFLDDLK